MNMTSFFSLAAVLCGTNIFAQTTLPAAPGRLFALPAVQLRPLASERCQPAQLAGPETQPESPSLQSSARMIRLPASEAPSARLSASSGVRDQLSLISQSAFDPDLYRHLEQGGFLARQSAGPATVAERCLDIFRPEVIHLGKTYVSCSLLTAIKRKNPLCLINPIFFNLSW